MRPQPTQAWPLASLLRLQCRLLLLRRPPSPITLPSLHLDLRCVASSWPPWNHARNGKRSVQGTAAAITPCHLRRAQSLQASAPRRASPLNRSSGVAAFGASHRNTLSATALTNQGAFTASTPATPRRAAPPAIFLGSRCHPCRCPATRPPGRQRTRALSSRRTTPTCAANRFTLDSSSLPARSRPSAPPLLRRRNRRQLHHHRPKPTPSLPWLASLALFGGRCAPRWRSS